MDQHFVQVEFSQIESSVRQHLAALPASTDSFHEDHVLTANHYEIIVSDEVAGFASIHKEDVITQFALSEPYRHHGQRIFARLRRHEHVQAALVPTNDQFFLAHALDDYRQLAKQACFFALAETRVPAIPPDYSLRLATTADIPLVRQESGDFFEPIERFIESEQLFVTEHDGNAAGFGLMDESKLQGNTASIGMFTNERFRNQGVGTVTITLLIGECQRRGLRPVAGCWYYNHSSKRTLEKAGMYSPTRYLRIEY